MTAYSFRQSTEEIIEQLKNGNGSHVKNKLKCTLYNGKKLICFVITKDIIKDEKTIQLLAHWRENNNKWFPAQFPVTFEGTKKWAKEQLLEKKDRILFFLQIKGQHTPFGHIGLYRFNYSKRACEIDNIIRGNNDKSTKGAITAGLQLLIDWTFTYLKIKDLYLQVFSDNKRAIALYERLGFKEISRIPLVSVRDNGVTKWIESGKEKTGIFRYFVKMHLSKKE